MQHIHEHGAEREEAVQNDRQPCTSWASQEAVNEHDANGQGNCDDPEAKILRKGEFLVQIGDLIGANLVVADRREDIRNGHTESEQARGIIAR